MGLNTFRFLFLLDTPEEVVPAEARLLGKVTDSNILECASLGVNLGALRRGLRLCRSKRVPEWSGENSRAEVAVPAGEKPGANPTSSGVSGGGRKLSNIGLRIRPSLAYLAEEKYCGSDLECFKEVHLNVGSRRIDFRFPGRGAAEAGRKGEASGMVGGMSQGVWSARLEGGCSGGGGGLSRGGGGEEELGCGGTVGSVGNFLAALDPKLLSDTEYLRLRRSLLSFSGDWGRGSGGWTSGVSLRSSGRP